MRNLSEKYLCAFEMLRYYEPEPWDIFITGRWERVHLFWSKLLCRSAPSIGAVDDFDGLLMIYVPFCISALSLPRAAPGRTNWSRWIDGRMNDWNGMVTSGRPDYY